MHKNVNRTVLGGGAGLSLRRVSRIGGFVASATLAAYFGGLIGTDRKNRISAKRAGKRTKAFLTSSVYAIISSKSVRNITLTSLLLTLLLRSLPLDSLGMSFLSKGLRRRSGGMFALFLFSIYYSKYVVEAPVFRYKRTFFNVSIVEKMRPSQLVYSPTFWAFNRHAQTVMLFMLGHIEWWWSSLKWRREEIRAHDGNVLHLDWACFDGDEDSAGNPDMPHYCNAAPIVTLIHGLGDSRNYPYMMRTARACHKMGWRVAAYSYWRLDFADSRDLTTIFDRLHDQNPNAPIVAVAYSAGGHILMRYLQEAGKACPLSAAVTNSGCFDFVEAVKNVKNNENPSYKIFLNAQFKICMKRFLKNERSFRSLDGHPPALDPNSLLKYATATSPIGGDAILEYDRMMYKYGRYTNMDPEEHSDGDYVFKKNTASHYAVTAASGMKKVRVTTLVMQADDDPIVNGDHFDAQNVLRINKNIIFVHTKRGGHVSWYEGWTPFGPTWADRTTVAFFSAIFEMQNQTAYMLDTLSKAGIGNLFAGTRGGLSPPSYQVDGNDLSMINRISHRISPSQQNDTAFDPSAIARLCSSSDLASYFNVISNDGGGGRGTNHRRTSNKDKVYF